MANRNPAPNPTLEQWASLRIAWVECDEALSETFGQSGLLNPPISREERQRQLQHRIDIAVKEPAYSWLKLQSGYCDALATFKRRISHRIEDQVRFIAPLCFYLHIFHFERAYPSRWSGAAAHSRRTAAKCARELSRLVSEENAGFEYRLDDGILLNLLDRYAADNERLSKVRKDREDKTSAMRRFVKGLAASMLLTFRKAPPAVLKPLGTLIDYELDDRGWTRLLAEARGEFGARKRKALAEALIRRAPQRGTHSLASIGLSLAPAEKVIK